MKTYLIAIVFSMLLLSSCKNSADDYNKDLERTGFFDNIAMNNIAEKINSGEYTGSEKDATFWAEMASIGYPYNPYDRNDELFNPDENIIIKSYVIPESFDKGLIDELVESMYNGSYYDLLNKYEVKDAKVLDNDVDLELKDDIINSIGDRGLYPRYMNAYIQDLNGDGTNEFLRYYLTGSDGSTQIIYTTENENGVFSDVNAVYHDLGGYGYNTMIEYNGKIYLIVLSEDFNYGYISGIQVYSLNKDNIMESAWISKNISGINYVTTTFPSKQYKQVTENVLKDFDEVIFVDKYGNFDFGNSIDGKVDINNDGNLEEYEFFTNLSMSVNWKTRLKLNIKNPKDEEVIKPILELFDEKHIPQVLNVKEVDGQNYVYLITQYANSRYLNLTIYHLNEDDLRLVSNHLIYLDEYYDVYTRPIEQFAPYYNHETEDVVAETEKNNIITFEKDKEVVEELLDTVEDVKVREIYMDILLNNSSDIFEQHEYDDYVFKPKYLTLVDFDHDDVPELYLSDYNIFGVVIHVEDGKPVAYWFSNKEMQQIKADGTFGQYGGAGSESINEIEFIGNGEYEITEIFYREDLTYFKDGKEISKEEYTKLYENHRNEKEKPVWIELNEK